MPGLEQDFWHEGSSTQTVVIMGQAYPDPKYYNSDADARKGNPSHPYERFNWEWDLPEIFDKIKFLVEEKFAQFYYILFPIEKSYLGVVLK